MDMKSYINEIKLKLGGSVLDLELNDSAFQQIIETSFREIQRYIDSTRLATIPFKECIDLSDCHVSSVARVFRAEGYQTDKDSGKSMDPMQLQQWQLIYGRGMHNMNDWVYNYASWNTLMQMKNTTSTDLAFRYDRHTNYLYINTNGDRPSFITIEYVPRYDNVDEIVSDYWIDKLIQLSLAYSKIALGRIRSRFTQSNILWTQDGETMLNEGNEELKSLQDELKTNHQLCYPID